MTALFYISAAVLILGMVASILMIGEPRKPLTPGGVLFALIVNGTILFTLIHYWQEAL